MKFSIVIPLYNKQRYIRQAIESVLAQTLQDFELLVVNDASTDGSRELAQSYGRVKLIDHGRNKGLSASRNTG
ncbi:MAG TPA: glycosyltransferase family 2 protein, partial [Flavobacterium sp.]|nr:glycosyltransferase family 2 protein [Flavobacterium sp.]